METPIVVSLIGAAAETFATIGGWIAAARLAKAQRQRDAAEKHAAAEVAERQRMDARWERLVDELQEENTRLRARLDRRDGTP